MYVFIWRLETECPSTKMAKALNHFITKNLFVTKFQASDYFYYFIVLYILGCFNFYVVFWLLLLIAEKHRLPIPKFLWIHVFHRHNIYGFFLRINFKNFEVLQCFDNEPAQHSLPLTQSNSIRISNI